MINDAKPFDGSMLVRELDPDIDPTWPPPEVEDRRADSSDFRPFSELMDTGLLWLINSVVFHPRGFALSLFRNQVSGDVEGWCLKGDGTEPWVMPDDDVTQMRWEAAEATFACHRIGGAVRQLAVWLPVPPVESSS